MGEGGGGQWNFDIQTLYKFVCKLWIIISISSAYCVNEENHQNAKSALAVLMAHR